FGTRRQRQMCIRDSCLSPSSTCSRRSYAASFPPCSAARLRESFEEGRCRMATVKAPPSRVHAPSPSPSRILQRALLPMLLVSASLAALHPILEEDLWWHLRAGSEMLHGLGIPRVDTYSYPSAGNPYIDLHWSFQAAASLIQRAFGLDGVILVKCLLAAAIFGIVYRLARRGAPAWIAAFLTAAGVVLASERFLARPEMVTYALLAATLWALQRHEEGSPRAWILLPIVTLISVNVEGLFVLGLLVIAARLSGRPRDRKLWLGFGLSLLATLINPYFATGAVHPLVLFTRVSGAMAIYSQTIGELRSPFAPGIPHPAIFVFPYFLALCALALVLHGRRPRLWEILLMIAFVYLGIRSRRTLAPLAIVAVPILARWIGEGRGTAWLESKLAPRARSAATTAAAVAILVGLAGYDLCLANGMIQEAIGTNRRLGFGIAETADLRRCASFLHDNRIRGPMFHTLSTGGYLIYGYPEEKVFIDGRLEVHTAEHYAAYLAILGGGDAWKSADARYGFRCLVLNYAEAPKLTAERLADPAWAPVYLDDSAIVILRDDPENRGTIESHLLTRDTLPRRFPSLESGGAVGATLPSA
ncbi:MAG: hypothetical protein QUU85_06140, partial [Candidatus Eisenbacteria bacterium]|nr:hypothetical protein [Candidatus Eisenbacteria bacterium]